MIKIIGGKHRGRVLETPEGKATRPTASRAREALFNVLMHARWRDMDEDGGTSPLIDARVLDGYAGSGALGLEALSRGAEHVTFLDNDAAAIKAIGENLRKLGETGAAKVVRAGHDPAATVSRAVPPRPSRSALPLRRGRGGHHRSRQCRLDGPGRRRHGRTRVQ